MPIAPASKKVYNSCNAPITYDPDKKYGTAMAGSGKDVAMEFVLGVTTCDKCQEPMVKEQPILVIAEGSIIRSDNDLTVEGSCVRYACHLNCWNGIEDNDLAKTYGSCHK